MSLSRREVGLHKPALHHNKHYVCSENTTLESGYVCRIGAGDWAALTEYLVRPYVQAVRPGLRTRDCHEPLAQTVGSLVHQRRRQVTTAHIMTTVKSPWPTPACSHVPTRHRHRLLILRGFQPSITKVFIGDCSHLSTQVKMVVLYIVNSWRYICHQ